MASVSGKDFLARTTVKNDAYKLKPGEFRFLASFTFRRESLDPNSFTSLTTVMQSKPSHPETLSPLDSTIYTGKARPGMLLAKDDVASVPTLDKSVKAVEPKDFLRKGLGLGGTTKVDVTLAAAERRKAYSTEGKLASPPRAGATLLRHNPPNTELRRYYERSDLPVVILQ
jgi:hypothetical protein